MVGGSSAKRSPEAWRQVYRALDHGRARNACNQTDTIQKFPKDIQDFANFFLAMQTKRYEADYDPMAKFFKSAVNIDIAMAASTISNFGKVPILDRRAFAAWVLFQNRR